MWSFLARAHVTGMEGRHLKLIYEFELSIHNSYLKDCLTLNHNSSHSIHNNLLSQVFILY